MGKRAALTLALMLMCSLRAPAATPTAGININLFTGSYQGSQQQSASLPVVPVPALTVKVPVEQFALYVEDVPPIGPVSYGNGFGGTQSTKLSYFASQLAWHTPNNRIEAGAGTTLINQITYYNSFINNQSSRVAGFRFSIRARLEASGRNTTDLTIALSPSMHGVQNTEFATRCGGIACLPATRDAEVASLADVTAQRTQTHGNFALLYGIRYLNYVAHFSANGHPADHDIALMLFAGFAIGLGR